mgnify:CR=1 FL=1
MTTVTLGPCPFVFEVENFVGGSAANGGLPFHIEECIKNVLRAIRDFGRDVDLEYISDGICIFEECGAFIHIKREPTVIAILRIEIV